jgi:hypothetical protein
MHDLMEDLALWLYGLGVLGIFFWFIWHVVAKFGWSGLLVKFALYIDGIFLTIVVAVHQTPWAAFRHHPRHIDAGSLLWAAALCYLCAYCLMFDRPMRRLMKPLAKWPLYSGAVLVCGGAFCAGKGWL